MVSFTEREVSELESHAGPEAPSSLIYDIVSKWLSRRRRK